MKKKFKYSLNEFLSQTRKRSEKAVKLGIYHLAILKYYLDLYLTDADYILMYNRTKPLVEDAQAKLAAVSSVEDAQVAKTEEVANRLKTIKGRLGKARKWFNKTAGVYATDNPVRMTAIWNKGLKPFNGTVNQVITALIALSTNIGGDENEIMIAIKEEVDAEIAFLNPKRSTQLAGIDATAIMYAALHNACVALMKMEYRNTGLLMNKFPDDDNYIQESFHDMELLLGKLQTKWDITLTNRETKDLAKRTLTASSNIRATAIGGTAMVYLGKTAGGIDSDGVEIEDGIPKKFKAADFGISEYGVYRYITVVNQVQADIRFKFNL